jgi:hypothetical protein
MTHSIRIIGGLSIFAICCCFQAGVVGQGKDTKDTKDSGVQSGIVFDRNDKKLVVKFDGQDETTEFPIDKNDKKLAKSLSAIFSVARVKVAYKTVDGAKQLVGIEKTVSKAQGTITGTVIATHDWWIELKPKVGPPDGFACTYPKELWDATKATIKQLQKDDVVSIDYYTDLERHRIKSIRKAAK